MTEKCSLSPPLALGSGLYAEAVLGAQTHGTPRFRGFGSLDSLDLAVNSEDQVD